MTVTIPYPTLSDPIDSDEIIANFRALENKLGNLDTSDLSAAAAITALQLESQYQEAIVTMTVRAEELSAGNWPGGNTVVAAAPIPGVVGEDTWRVVQIAWCCTDTGGGTGTAAIKYGTFESGSFASAGTVDTFTIANDPGANSSNAILEYSKVYSTGYSLAFSASPRSLVLESTGADATTLTATGSFLNVSVSLRRKILTS